jgi:aerobic carbon-monoxide dehydrogenase medium subunit
MSYDYREPASLEEVVATLVEHGDDAHLIAGGASLILMLRQQLLAPALLVGLRGVPGLGEVEVGADGWLEIGAMATHRAIERSDLVRSHAPALADACGRVATVRIRNQGTIGGNLAHADPAQDPPPMLMALDATAEVAGPAGIRSIPVADLFVDYFETSLEPAEVITAVRLPPRPPGSAATYVKFLPGSKDDYATVSVAVSGVLEAGRWHQLRIACGAAGSVPLRIPAAEARLEDGPLEARDVAAAAELVAAAVDPIDDVRGSAEYKREMAGVWTRRALERMAMGTA